MSVNIAHVSTGYVTDELKAYAICCIMIFAICGTALYQDSGGEVPECVSLTAVVDEKVYPIPETNLHGIVLLVDDEVNDTFDGKYYVIVSNSTYDEYEIGDAFSQLVCSAEEYENLKELIYYVLALDFIFQS